MPNERVTRKKIISFLRDADDMVHLISGRRIKDFVRKGVDLFGEDIEAKIVGKEPEVPSDSPYNILGVRPDACDIVVRGAFRSLAREFHPDTGTHPDPKAFQRVQEAYNEIVKGRSSGA